MLHPGLHPRCGRGKETSLWNRNCLSDYYEGKQGDINDPLHRALQKASQSEALFSTSWSAQQHYFGAGPCYLLLLTPVINNKGFTSSEMQLLYDEHHCPLKGNALVSSHCFCSCFLCPALLRWQSRSFKTSDFRSSGCAFSSEFVKLHFLRVSPSVVGGMGAEGWIPGTGLWVVQQIQHQL